MTAGINKRLTDKHKAAGGAEISGCCCCYRVHTHTRKYSIKLPVDYEPPEENFLKKSECSIYPLGIGAFRIG
jgi:hypothetical protein